jgi:hypothetical protein
MISKPALETKVLTDRGVSHIRDEVKNIDAQKGQYKHNDH